MKRFMQGSFTIFCLLIFLNLLIANIYASKSITSSEKISVIDKKINDCDEKIKNIDNDATLTDETKKQINTYFQNAIKSLERQKKAVQEADNYTEKLNENNAVSGQGDDFNFERPGIIEEKARTMALVEIEGEIFKLHTQLANEQKMFSQNKEKLKVSYVQPAKLKETISNYGKEIKDIENHLADFTKSKGDSKLLNAEKISFTAKRNALKEELAIAEKKTELLKTKMNSYNTNLIVLSSKIQRLQDMIKTWEKVKNNREINIGYSELRESEKYLKKMSSPDWPKEENYLKIIAERNVALAKTIIGLQRKEETANTTLALLESRLKQNNESFELTKRRVNMLGLTKKSSMMLQARRASLQTDFADPGIAAKRQSEIVDISLKNDDIICEIQKYLAEKNKVFEGFSKIQGKISEQDYNMLSTQAYVLLESYRELLEQVTKSYNDYLNLLNRQQTTQRDIDKVSKEFREYINQRLLWAKSGDVFSLSDIIASKKAVLWLIKRKNWLDFYKDISYTVTQASGTWILILILFIFSLVISFSKRIDNYISKISARKNVLSCCVCIFLSIMKAVSVPLVFYVAAIQTYENDYYIFTWAFMEAVLRCSLTATVCLMLLELSKLNGLGRIYFNWTDRICAFIHKNVKIILYIINPLFFLIIMIQCGPLTMGYRGTLGRILFVFSMVIICYVAVKNITFYKKRKKERKSKQHEKKKLYLWVSATVVIIPVILAFITLIGYYFTALQLFISFWEIICFVAILIILNFTLNKILVIINDKITEDRKKNKELEENLAEKQGDLLDSDGITLNICESDQRMESKDFERMFKQLIRFFIIITGIIGISIMLTNLIPAMRLLDSIVLWQHSVSLKDGGSRVDSITFLNLIKSIIVFIFAYVVVKNLSAVFEIFNLRKTKMHPGTRYAFELICQYFISGVGFFWGLSLLGIGWEQFQYIAAAMTLGLSFGLQEIFANFVSGIIILFERPIRLGDSVSVGGCMGTVSKIRIRSTTITNYDRHEIIVPNKTFLTDKITNWSLSDKIIRVIIDVGVAYGSDTAKVEKLLLQIANKNLLIIKDPAPSVVFSGFGADSLDFKLRVFTEVADNIKVQNLLRHEINKRFIEEGLEIPFAQRDIHINSNEGPLKIQLMNNKENI